MSVHVHWPQFHAPRWLRGHSRAGRCGHRMQCRRAHHGSSAALMAVVAVIALSICASVAYVAGVAATQAAQRHAGLEASAIRVDAQPASAADDPMSLLLDVPPASAEAISL